MGGDYDVVNLERVARRAWANVDTEGATLCVEDLDQWTAADRDRLQEVFENLFRNSVEHGGEGVTVSVGPLRGGESGFYVADDGPGIPPKEQNTVFKRGYTSAGTGTGLGLPVVEQIVGAHGWSVRVVESESGGARFEITGVE